jgi:hypothetical protein
LAGTLAVAVGFLLVPVISRIGAKGAAPVEKGPEDER